MRGEIGNQEQTIGDSGDDLESGDQEHFEGADFEEQQQLEVV